MRILNTLLITTILSGCSFFAPYHVEVQQGNLVTKEMMSEVKLGMTRDQIKFLLGNPVMDKAFAENEWLYYYQSQIGEQPAVYQLVKLYFDGDNLDKIEGDPVLSEQTL